MNPQTKCKRVSLCADSQVQRLEEFCLPCPGLWGEPLCPRSHHPTLWTLSLGLTRSRGCPASGRSPPLSACSPSPAHPAGWRRESAQSQAFARGPGPAPVGRGVDRVSAGLFISSALDESRRGCAGGLVMGRMLLRTKVGRITILRRFIPPKFQ